MVDSFASNNEVSQTADAVLVSNVSKSYGSHPVLRNLSMQIEEGIL